MYFVGIQGGFFFFFFFKQGFSQVRGQKSMDCEKAIYCPIHLASIQKAQITLEPLKWRFLIQKDEANKIVNLLRELMGCYAALF